MKKYLIILLLIPHFCLAEMVDKIVAKVGSEVITQSDMSQAMARQKKMLLQRFGKKKGNGRVSKIQKKCTQ